jgi:hypothetical protein
MLALSLLIALGIVALYHQDEIKMMMAYLQSDRAHPALIGTAFTVLPLVFFPITPLLAFVGIRFDFVWALVIVFLSIPVHLGFAYLTARSVLPGRLQELAEKKGYLTERVAKERRLQLAFLFMAVPGLPYSVKNCLLSLAGISFGWYLSIGCCNRTRIGDHSGEVMPDSPNDGPSKTRRSAADPRSPPGGFPMHPFGATATGWTLCQPTGQYDTFSQIWKDKEVNNEKNRGVVNGSVRGFRVHPAR